MPITRDPLFFAAAEFVIKTNNCGIAHLQRKFTLGAYRATTLIGELQKAGVIGAFQSNNYGMGSLYPILADEKYLAELIAAAEETP